MSSTAPNLQRAATEQARQLAAVGVPGTPETIAFRVASPGGKLHRASGTCSGALLRQQAEVRVEDLDAAALCRICARDPLGPEHLTWATPAGFVLDAASRLLARHPDAAGRAPNAVTARALAAASPADRTELAGALALDLTLHALWHARSPARDALAGLADIAWALARDEPEAHGRGARIATLVTAHPTDPDQLPALPAGALTKAHAAWQRGWASGGYAGARRAAHDTLETLLRAAPTLAMIPTAARTHGSDHADPVAWAMAEWRPAAEEQAAAAVDALDAAHAAAAAQLDAVPRVIAAVDLRVPTTIGRPLDGAELLGHADGVWRLDQDSCGGPAGGFTRGRRLRAIVALDSLSAALLSRGRDTDVTLLGDPGAADTSELTRAAAALWRPDAPDEPMSDPLIATRAAALALGVRLDPVR